ncbi:MAG: CHAP domain-containing protein [Clostridiales bacterium]|nr:CHAP domain-containing protein [Clostridiales bacterium]
MYKRIAALALVLLLAFALGGNAQQAQEVIPPRYDVPDHVAALLEVARGELGYTEQRDGTTKYGQWYGDPKAEWCAEFLCWSVAQAEEALEQPLLEVHYPLYGATNIGRNWFLAQGRYIARTGFVTGWGSQWYTGESAQMERNSYIPQPGDWVFFSYTPSGDTTHVALVEQSLRDPQGQVFIQVIEGNMPDSVQRTLYALTDWRIQGYGTVRDLADIVLRGGLESKKVAALQSDLATIGLLAPNEVHGRYNHPTQDAVRSFQSMRNLPQTGIANQQTQLALRAYTRDWMMNHTEFWTVDGAY